MGSQLLRAKSKGNLWEKEEGKGGRPKGADEQARDKGVPKIPNSMEKGTKGKRLLLAYLLKKKQPKKKKRWGGGRGRKKEATHEKHKRSH